MFKIKLIKNHPFKIKVHGYSKINSMVLNVARKPYKMIADLKMYLKSQTTIANASKIIIDKIKLITKPRLDIEYKNTKVIASPSSKEKILANVSSDRIINMDMISKEKIRNTLKSKTTMLLSPIVGYFKKLYEFDSKNLSELDNLSLEDMDYEAKLMANGEENI